MLLSELERARHGARCAKTLEKPIIKHIWCEVRGARPAFQLQLELEVLAPILYISISLFFFAPAPSSGLGKNKKLRELFMYWLLAASGVRKAQERKRGTKIR